MFDCFWRLFIYLRTSRYFHNQVEMYFFLNPYSSYFWMSPNILLFTIQALTHLSLHGLKSRLSAEMLSVFDVGVRYQMYHAFALIAAAWMQSKWPSSLVKTGGWLFVIGTITGRP